MAEAEQMEVELWFLDSTTAFGKDAWMESTKKAEKVMIDLDLPELDRKRWNLKEVQFKTDDKYGGLPYMTQAYDTEVVFKLPSFSKKQVWIMLCGFYGKHIDVAQFQEVKVAKATMKIKDSYIKMLEKENKDLHESMTMLLTRKGEVIAREIGMVDPTPKVRELLEAFAKIRERRGD